jgi:phage/plasmid-associated DNA primase
MSRDVPDWRDEVRSVEAVALGAQDVIVSRATELLSLFQSAGAELADRCCVAANAAVMDPETSAAETRRVQRLLEFLFYAKQSAGSLLASLTSVRSLGGRGGAAANSTDADADGDDADDARARANSELLACISRFSPQCIEDANKVQQLILYLLNCLHQSGYRRYDGDCYEVRHTDDEARLSTRSWRRVCSIRDFVYQRTQKEFNFDMWLNLTRVRTNAAAVVDHLAQCRDVQFPDLVRDRHVFAFRRGLYFAREDRYVKYEDVDEDVVAAKFFDLDFPEGPDAEEATSAEDWEPPTPHLQSILNYQNMSPDASWWMYVFIGRLIYSVGELDEWQVVPYLRGAASTGKSTILTRVCREIYEPQDVGVLSNNIERKFGISALADKLVFIAPEIKADIALEQAEFQSIVSGETIQVAVKHAMARTVEWSVPGILAGNEVPGWVDNSGSINRRIVLFEFDNRVTKGDMMLGRKLADEMACILRRANRAYLKAVRMYARDNVWLHLPPEFLRAKEELSESVNSMVSFLRCGRLAFDQEFYIPFVDFMEAYKDYCRQTGQRAIPQSEFKNHLRAASCTVLTRTTLRYPRSERGTFVANAKFVLGVDFAAACQQDEGV